MEYKLILDRSRPEEVLVYAHRESRLTRAIEELCAENGLCLMGYREREMIPIELSAVCCFTVEDNKIYALTDSGKLQLKCRLYSLEEALPQSFAKINQSCIANLRRIDRFDSSFSGTLLVHFQNGHTDYVSRRNLKSIKERLAQLYA